LWFNKKEMKKFWKEYLGAHMGQFGCVLIDLVVMAIAYYMAFLLRFDFQAPWWGWARVSHSFVTVAVVQSVALTLFGCYKLVWRYVSVGDVPRFVGAIGTSTAILLLMRVCFPDGYGIRPPYSIALFNGVLLAMGLLAARVLWRFWADGVFELDTVAQGKVRHVLLVGAGSTGNLVARELKRKNARRWVVVGFLDDDSSKAHAKIQGFPVLGRIDDLPEVVRTYGVEEVVVSIANVSRELIRRVVRLGERVHVPTRIVPGYFELIDGSLTASKIRDVDVADLLGRAEAMSDGRSVVELLGQKRVLVTGAGGTIGSELVRQILRTGPAQLVLVERSEIALYEIEREIRGLGSETSVVACLADIGERQRMEAIFEQFKPQIVVHAAAYKHVPMMEMNPVEAVKNNILATQSLGEMAVKHGVDRFVFISTDKAVHPVSIMGISKRLAEIALQGLNRRNRTQFSAVRFGNVLDSSGSVVPLFREQIRKGVAVTVTHPEMTRYFMTISEAVSLVLQAAALAKGGEIFVLDMGEPVKIVELAEEMIALSGLRPYEDIPIVFTGIRPGEKLFEELDVSERSAYKTGHARIFISKICEVRTTEIDKLIGVCQDLCANAPNANTVRDALKVLLSRVVSSENGG